MPRLFAALLVCSFATFAQTTGAISLIDAVVLDAGGHAVTGLTPADFEITVAGKNESVVRLTSVDAIRHTALTATALPALELTPDQIHRTTVFVVDDLCLPAGALQEARAHLHSFLDQLAPEDRSAILRTSGGSSRQRQLTGDRAELAKVIDTTEYLGGSVAPASCSTAAWSAVTFALTGLEPVAGRKTIVLMSGDLHAPTGNAAAGIERLAAATMTAIYQVSAAAPLLAASTGGAAGVTLERVLSETASYYVLASETTGGDVQVKVRPPGLTVRVRHAPAGLPLRTAFPAPDVLRDLPLIDAMNAPFGGGIAVQATSLFSNSAKEGGIVETMCYIDARDLGYLRDSAGRYHLDFEVGVGTGLPGGPITSAPMTERTLNLSPDEYRQLLEEGLVETLRLRGWASGARDLRVAVADRRSGAAGSANTLVEVHTMAPPAFFLSGMAVEAGSGVKKSPAVRLFHSGDEVTFTYYIYNALADAERRSRVNAQTRLVAGGREVLSSAPAPIVFEPSTDNVRRLVRGRLKLDPAIAPGRYILEVTVTDLVAREPRVAHQFMDFTIEP